MDKKTIDKHSVNCFICGNLCDERECMPGIDNEGSICPECTLYCRCGEVATISGLYGDNLCENCSNYEHAR